VPGLRTIGEAGQRLAALALGVVFFLLVIVGGGVYRTDCATKSGTHEKSWRLGDTIPYLTGAREGCKQDSLTRYVLGKVGVMSDVEPTYNASLIRKIGAGSTEVASFVPTLKSASGFHGSLNEPKLEALTLLLLRGELNKLTPHDLLLLAEANRHTAQHLIGVVNTIETTLSAHLQADHIDPKAYGTLSSGVHRFVTSWNLFLTSSAILFDREGLALLSTQTTLQGFQTLLRAALLTQRSQSVKEYSHVKTQYIANLARVKKKYRDTISAAVREAESSDQKLAAVVRHNGEAKALVEQVNTQYPHGELAEQFKNP
jgi:hypothetical protein